MRKRRLIGLSVSPQLFLTGNFSQRYEGIFLFLFSALVRDASFMTDYSKAAFSTDFSELCKYLR